VEKWEKEMKRQVVEEQLGAWRFNLERTRIQNKVALALDDKEMQGRVQAEATRCIKAIECLEEMLKEVSNG